ncbi:hypothetical protein ZEAMMB73_Zm00001d053411 [Zea mays]|uniref:Uncharacterized protein n=1 Tax=Zea mays TaxID=4577 RepID=A0A1D6QPC9_MAIZE|nr:hypothetical protein ZEAMMB73_Zm00001d053411 [Zea mays]AQK59422.1 hypothetical protein ZEAMMB73_Zm00001d053411 [Zea mays]
MRHPRRASLWPGTGAASLEAEGGTRRASPSVVLQTSLIVLRHNKVSCTAGDANVDHPIRFGMPATAYSELLDRRAISGAANISYRPRAHQAWLEAGISGDFPLDSLYNKYCERMLVFHKIIVQLMKIQDIVTAAEFFLL